MKKLILIAFVFSFSFSLLAADGSSGCGPGWYLFKKNSLVSSSLRATTNGILFPVTTIGMTVGTSNCSQHSLVKTEKESLKYATENYFEILAEASKGQGQFIDGFASTIGCQKDSLGTFGRELQRNFEKLYPQENVNPEEMLKETYIIILNNRELLYSCSLT